MSSEYFILNCHLNDLKNSLKRKCKIIGARTKVSRAAARFLAASGDLDPGVSSPAPAPSDPGRCNLSSLKTVLIFRSHPKAGAHVLAIPTSSLVLRTTNLRVRIIKKKFFHFSPGPYFENLEIQMPVSGQCFASPRRNEGCAYRRRARIEVMAFLFLKPNLARV